MFVLAFAPPNYHKALKGDATGRCSALDLTKRDVHLFLWAVLKKAQEDRRMLNGTSSFKHLASHCLQNIKLKCFAFFALLILLINESKYRLVHPQGRHLVAVVDWRWWWWFISSPLHVKQMYRVYPFFFTPRLIVIAFKLQLKMNVMSGPFSTAVHDTPNAQTRAYIYTHWQMQVKLHLKNIIIEIYILQFTKSE